MILIRETEMLATINKKVKMNGFKRIKPYSLIKTLKIVNSQKRCIRNKIKLVNEELTFFNTFERPCFVKEKTILIIDLLMLQAPLWACKVEQVGELSHHPRHVMRVEK